MRNYCDFRIVEGIVICLRQGESAMSNQAELIVVDGKMSGAVFELLTVTTIGSGAFCDIHLQGKLHEEEARIVYEQNENAYVIFPGSTAGSLSINGKTVTDRFTLCHGDVITMSGVTFLFGQELSSRPTPVRIRQLPDSRAHDVLTALAEPLLADCIDPTAEIYRLLCLPSVTAPETVRLEFSSGKAILTAQQMKTYKRGLSRYAIVNLSPLQQAEFMSHLEQADFWQLPAERDIDFVPCIDGAEWLLEGMKNGRYHIVSRATVMSRRYDQEFYRCCQLLLDIAFP